MEENIDDKSKRFLKLLSTNNISGYKLMQDGVIKSQSTLTNIKNGKQGVSGKLLDKCSELYGFDKAYILLGGSVGNVTNSRGQLIINAPNSTIVDSNNSGVSGRRSSVEAVGGYMREELVNVPFVLQDAAASFIEGFGDMQNMQTDIYGVMQENGEDLSNGTYVVFQVNGESMTPNIPDRAKVLARRIAEEKWEEATGVVFVAYGKTLTIKRVLKNMLYSSNILTLKADNPIYGQIDVNRGEIRGIWKAERIVSQKII